MDIEKLYVSTSNRGGGGGLIIRQITGFAIFFEWWGGGERGAIHLGNGGLCSEFCGSFFVCFLSLGTVVYM